MYVRFVVHTKDRKSGRREGLFQAAGRLRDGKQLTLEEEARYVAVYNWFNAELRVPSKFAKASRHHASKAALSWFKDSAAAYIARMREIAVILEAHDVAVVMLRTDRPGFVVYEDEFQIAAEPFYDTPT